MSAQQAMAFISIHPPREGWDRRVSHRDCAAAPISIHPPREGWDRPLCLLFFELARFQSTHPVRGGTRPVHPKSCDMAISIHPPREGWDDSQSSEEMIEVLFQSTHPVRGGTAS